MNLFLIQTNIRGAYIWVNGNERTASAGYMRAKGEIVYAIVRSIYNH